MRYRTTFSIRTPATDSADVEISFDLNNPIEFQKHIKKSLEEYFEGSKVSVKKTTNIPRTNPAQIIRDRIVELSEGDAHGEISGLSYAVGVVEALGGKIE